jgi:anti-anti-sigma factor
MEIKVNQTDSYSEISIAGRLDTITAAEFEVAVKNVMETERKHVIIDCSGLDYISSSGLRVFLMLQKMVIDIKATLSICCLKSHIMEIFEITGFSKIFRIYADLESAMAG